MIEHLTDHEERGVALLIERYRKPRISALLASWLHEVQILEDVLFELLEHILDRQLDVLGRIVGQPREGRSDEVYLLWIKARVLVNRSSGKTQQLIDIVKALGVTGVRLEEQYPAAAVIHADAPLVDLATGGQIARLLHSAKAGGVALYFHWFSGTPFRFAPGTAPVADDPGGFDHGLWSAASDGTDTLVVSDLYGGPG